MPLTEKKGIIMKKKNTVTVPAYKESRHSSAQALRSQRMPARVYDDKKKKMSRNACRNRHCFD